MNKDERYYDTEIGKLPSVTTILSVLSKPALVNWSAKITAEYFIKHLQDIKEGKLELTEEKITQLIKQAKNEHNKVSEQALTTGSIVHHAIEVWIKTGKIPAIDDEKAKNSFNAFLDWVKENKFKPIESEQTVWSKLGYAGTLDCVAELKDGLYVVDFKTSSGFYEEYVMQISAYMYAYNERTGKDIKKAGILRLDKATGIPHWKEYDNLPHYFEMFKCLLRYFRLSKEEK